MNVSVIICTRNHADSLQKTLESIGRSSVPPDWKIQVLIVDNGSTDNTHAVVTATHMANGVKLDYYLESRAGLCHARNSGLRVSTGEIILFTDDDVLVPTDWIKGMCSPISENRADAVAGGIVLPARHAFATSKAPLCNLRGWFAVSEFLDPDGPEFMIGANMAFHRRVLQRVPTFDIELGSGALGFEDETLFSKQIVVAGFRLTGALEIAVEHHFDLSRTHRDALLDAARRRGRSKAYLFHHWEHREEPLYLLRILLGRLRKVGFAFARITASVRAKQITLWELEVEKRLAFMQEYASQKKRSRRYSRYGLIALNRAS